MSTQLAVWAKRRAEEVRAESPQLAEVFDICRQILETKREREINRAFVRTTTDPRSGQKVHRVVSVEYR